ncbi:MAG: prolyl oligopeptidase family serine peptidase, partial [Bacteroidales bacterium]
SPDGTKLLVQGGPECFGDIGVNVSDDRIPNSYDSQLYIFDLISKKIDPITKTFDPTIHSAEWITEKEIYLSVGEKDYINLYKYDLKSQAFNKIDVDVEVLSDFDIAKNKPVAVYSGTSISTPKKLYSLNLKKESSTLLAFPEKERFANIKFGKTEPWNFTNKNGTTIYGRVYYPPHYDENKKYPVIVNYYAGTSPIERSFGGRYPINNWAANGYIVYVLQPSGATGFGQDFSALHVNGWGYDAIDDIIYGSKKFLEAHPTADAKNVGCIGASYGGYTTMLIQTRTDIFKTAISHAGISSITSYWGEGYWGYTYNAGAAKNSYPWNRKDIYVENSPVYNADKFQNSILLLHGTDDTNVPVGESLQYYAALNILGKDVEMVLVDGQDHHILDYKKRIQWHYTIISWFDKKLKQQPQQWNELYPEKNL